MLVSADIYSDYWHIIINVMALLLWIRHESETQSLVDQNTGLISDSVGSCSFNEVVSACSGGISFALQISQNLSNSINQIDFCSHHSMFSKIICSCLFASKKKTRFRDDSVSRCADNLLTFTTAAHRLFTDVRFNFACDETSSIQSNNVRVVID